MRENNLNYKSSSEYINKDEYSSKFTKEIGKIKRQQCKNNFLKKLLLISFHQQDYNVIGTIFDTI